MPRKTSTGRRAPRPPARPSSRKRAVTPAKMRDLIRRGKVPPHYAIAKSEGDAAVQAWIELLPEWQSARAKRVDAAATRAMRHVRKAVRWHGAWYGVPGGGWILAMASFRAHLKILFFDGASLAPPPPVPLAAPRQRALDLRETDVLDEARLARWLKQAIALPGWGEA